MEYLVEINEMDLRNNYVLYLFTWPCCLYSWVLNGNAHYHHKDNIPDQEENYILVSPHRTWWDPVYMAFATKPKQFIFMAKKNSSPIVFLAGGFVCGAFPIDRENPGAEAIKYPVNMLKKSNRSLIMFPVEAVILKTSKVVLPSLPKWRRSVSCQ